MLHVHCCLRQCLPTRLTVLSTQLRLHAKLQTLPCRYDSLLLLLRLSACSSCRRPAGSRLLLLWGPARPLLLLLQTQVAGQQRLLVRAWVRGCRLRWPQGRVQRCRRRNKEEQQTSKPQVYDVATGVPLQVATGQRVLRTRSPARRQGETLSLGLPTYTFSCKPKHDRSITCLSLFTPIHIDANAADSPERRHDRAQASHGLHASGAACPHYTKSLYQ